MENRSIHCDRRESTGNTFPGLAGTDARRQLAPTKRAAARWLAWLAWALLLLAGANPRWLGEPLGVTTSGRDLMLVLDLSQSMEVKDFLLDDEPVDRLTALKSVAREFIRRREGDRHDAVAPGHPDAGRRRRRSRGLRGARRRRHRP